MLEEIHGGEDLVLGLDGTSTYFGRAFNEFHISGKTETELIGLLDWVGKFALHMLNEFILVWAKVNDVEARLSLPRTPLYTITSLTADTTTAMSEEFGGFQALFERARLGAWRQDGSIGNYKPSTYKQCDDRVTNLIRTLFNQRLIKNLEHNDLNYMIYTKKMGGKLAMHYHITRRLSKQVLTFKRSEFSSLKKEQDEREGAPPRALKLQRTSFNRSATFGVSGQCIPHYLEVFKQVVPANGEWLEDGNVEFLI